MVYLWVDPALYRAAFRYATYKMCLQGSVWRIEQNWDGEAQSCRACREPKEDSSGGDRLRVAYRADGMDLEGLGDSEGDVKVGEEG